MSGPQIPLFISNLWAMVENSDEDSIFWSADGRSFIIKVPDVIECLPKYFKHNNLSSFVRQLNFYGFRKITRDSTTSQFTHANFQRGRFDLLSNIKRKVNAGNALKAVDDHADIIASIADIRQDLDELKDKYDDLVAMNRQLVYIVATTLSQGSVSNFQMPPGGLKFLEEGLWNPRKRLRITDGSEIVKSDTPVVLPRRSSHLSTSSSSATSISDFPILLPDSSNSTFSSSLTLQPSYSVSPVYPNLSEPEVSSSPSLLSSLPDLSALDDISSSSHNNLLRNSSNSPTPHINTVTHQHTTTTTDPTTHAAAASITPSISLVDETIDNSNNDVSFDFLF